MYKTRTPSHLYRSVKGQPHYHKDSKGVLHECYHACVSTLKDKAFWFGVSISFPIEHWLWTKVWPFYLLSEWLGL